MTKDRSWSDDDDDDDGRGAVQSAEVDDDKDNAPSPAQQSVPYLSGQKEQNESAISGGKLNQNCVFEDDDDDDDDCSLCLTWMCKKNGISVQTSPRLW
ncbi:hypothetical protein T10_11224 [Trichinella papuae]|uniref:Uncharacterized protein n=1 Tax=Trichinella papuae TaxID=268474 RepID=A0A0V1M8V6_9BILA|nr:hypothetical protein T10_11224 [Trichinella papuae]